MRKNPPSRLRAILGLALTGALACLGGVAIPLSHAPDAQAREAGAGGQNGSSILGGGQGPITETLPSGVKVSISQPTILLSGGQGTFRPWTGYTNPSSGYETSTLHADWTAPASPPSGLIWAQPQKWNRTLPYTEPGEETVTLPQSYFNNNKFYDVMRFTVSFDPPVANPVMNMVMFGWLLGWDDNYLTKPFGKLSINGATDQNGNPISVTMSRAAGWDYGGFRFIFRNGGTSMEDPTPAANLNAHYIKGNNYSGGTTAFNSNDKLVSSITFTSSDAWAQRGNLRRALFENWGFQLQLPESDSSLSRTVPGSQYGDATHMITTTGVRLGATVAEGSKTRYTQTANSGTPSDNSDSGMDALRGRTLPAAAAGQVYTVDNIPVSNTSNRTLALQGWIDFNGNGRFDPNEASQAVTVAPGQTLATLSWNTPSAVATSGKQALRLRLGPADQIQNQPSGLASMGEVEDYAAFVPTQSAPDLKITKTTATSTIEPGGQVVYYLDVRNNSAATVNDISVSDRVPDQITSYTASGTQGSQYDGSRNLVWIIGSLAPGASARVTITGQVAATVAVGSTISNTGTVTSPQGCLNPASCSSTVTDRVSAATVRNISVQKTNSLSGSSPTVNPGDTFDYQIAVTNNSGQPYTNVVIKDQLPAGLTYVSGSGWTFNGQSGTATIPSLAVGERQVLTITVKVNNDATGVLKNVSVVDAINTIATCTAQPSADGCGVDPNPPTVIQTPLMIYKTNDLQSTTVTAGTEFTYTVSVSNPGALAAQGVRVTDVLPKELQFQSTTQDGWASISGQVAVSTLFDLAPGGEKLLYLKVRAVTATTQTVTNMVMAEQTGSSALLKALPPATAATANVAQDKIDACVDGDTTGTCTADKKPFTVVPEPQPVAPIDTWDTKPTTPAAPVNTDPSLSADIINSTQQVKGGGSFSSYVLVRNTSQQMKTVTVKAYAPDGASFPKSSNGTWTVSGRTATSVPMLAGPNAMTVLTLTTEVSGSAGQSYPVVYTLDGSDPSQCTKTASNCYWDMQPPRS